MLSPDLQRLARIYDYCTEIDRSVARFGESEDSFLEDRDYQRTITMCILQIGELANGLSEEYRSMTKVRVPWHLIRGLRNIVAHHYGKIDFDEVWQIVHEDIPSLKAFCIEQLPEEY